MHSKIESLKNNIEAGLLSGVLPVSRFSLKGFTDMLQLSFDSHVGDVSRVRGGEYFRYRPSAVIRYSLNIRMSSSSGLIFTWKNSMKPSDFIEIEHKLLSLYT